MASQAPGQSPISTGQLKLSAEIEAKIRAAIEEMRELNIPETRSAIMNEVTALIQDTDDEDSFKDGEVTKTWYYGFLSRCDLYTSGLVPLEDDRGLWSNNTVCCCGVLCKLPSVVLSAPVYLPRGRTHSVS